MKEKFKDGEIRKQVNILMRENKLSYEDAKYQFYLSIFGDIIEKKSLEILYLDKEYSLPSFKKEFGWHYGLTQFFLDYHGIPRRNILEGNRTQSRSKKLKATNLERYGYENVSQAQEIKDKKEKSAIEKYGCINVFQAQEIKDKSKETMMEKYGVERPINLPWHPNKAQRVSKPQIKLNEIINELGYETEMEKGELCKSFNETFGKIFNPCVDIWIKGEKLIFEMYGDLWHANPEIHDEEKIIYKFAGPTKASEIWEGDRIRENHIKSHGFTVCIIWEKELNSNKQKTKEKVKQLIENYFENKK